MSDDSPFLTAIVLNYNGASYVRRLFQSLREQTFQDFEILMVDNDSDDDSVALTRREFPEVRVVEFGQNLGYAEANNRAADLTTAPYICFLNNDTFLDKDALALLAAAAQRRPEAPILAPQQRTYDDLLTLSVGVGVDVLGFYYRGMPTDDQVFYADGACLFVRSKVFHEIGKFDPFYFMFFEECDLCWRAWLWGYRVQSVHDALVYHKAGAAAGSSIVANGQFTTSKRKRRLSHRNQWATLLKNYAAPTLVLIVPLFAFMTMAEVALLTIGGQHGVLREVYVPAWRDLAANWPYLMQRRHEVQRARVVGDWTIIRRMSLKLAAVERFRRSGLPRIT